MCCLSAKMIFEKIYSGRGCGFGERLSGDGDGESGGIASSKLIRTQSLEFQYATRLMY